MLAFHEGCLRNCSDEEHAQWQQSFRRKLTAPSFKSQPLRHAQLSTAAQQYRAEHRIDNVSCNLHQDATGTALCSIAFCPHVPTAVLAHF